VRRFTTVAGLRCHLKQVRAGHNAGSAPNSRPCGTVGFSVGLVPTMGALHEGHLSLIHRARQENDWVVVSIFVNPLQFGPHEDLTQYPRPLEHDQQLCEAAGVNVIFAPSPEELYRQANEVQSTQAAALLTQVVPPAEMTAVLCGSSRPGHFQGVATVVTKLLTIVQPERAYFGQKDAQQVAILKRLVADLNLPVDLVICPIVREPSGLALSSRNQYLSAADRAGAAVLYRSLRQAEVTFQAGERSRQDLINVVKSNLQTNPVVQPEYIELVHPDTMTPLDQVEDTALLAIAAKIGSTRLIDNIVLRVRQPVLAIDGPAGAGKSTVVRQVAQELELLYLDTGAMYRAVTWLVLQSGIAVDDEAAIAELVSQCEIDISGDPSTMRVVINGQDVTHAIRTPAVTAHVSTIAAQLSVRQELVKRQQSYGRRGGIVMDGRDIGTCVFPDAELKIFLTASVQERARRRQQDLKSQGQPEIALADLERQIDERDFKDSTREISPLRKAADAIEIQTDHLAVEAVVAKIVTLYRDKTAQLEEIQPPVLG
jgi:pantoate ligase / CMP/dCMP kinase